MMDMMDCAALLRELSDYLDNQVDAALRQEIETHLKACKRCWVLTDSLRKTLRIVADEHVVELPAGFSERLKARLERGMGTP